MNSPDDITNRSGTLLMNARTRAKLRRTDPYEVREAYEWVRLAKGRKSLAQANESALMASTPLVAEVRQDSKQTLGEALRGVNERRVRRLLAADREEILDQLRKAVRLIGRSVNIEDLVATAVYWGEQRRRSLAREYFKQGDAEDGQRE
jgi:CRISPR type I-E-associated protein CasB/Cse2